MNANEGRNRYAEHDEQQERIQRWLIWLVAGAILVIMFSGCAFNRPNFKESVAGTNGTVTTRALSVPTWALWPATSALTSQKASLGKTFSVGTSELTQEAQSTNAVEALREMRRIFEALPR